MSESAVKPASAATAVQPAAPAANQPRPSSPPPKLIPPPPVGTTDLSAAPEPAQAIADAAVHGILARHWNTVGIRPTMDLAELETTFYLMIEGFSDNPTEEEEARRQEMQRSYGILRRALEQRVVVTSPRLEMPGFSPRQRITLGIAATIGLAALAYLNAGAIKLRWAEYEPGAVIRFAGKSEPYATVIRFDPAHQFAVGQPTRAYQLKLAGSDEVVWLSERVVEKGMVPTK